MAGEMYAVSGETLTGIANAIRSKTRSDDFMTVDSMAVAIEGIPSSGSSVVSQEWEVNEFHSYDTFNAFKRVYNLPVLNYECTVYNYTFENNTDNLRAGKYVNGIAGKTINGDHLKLEIGSRVGGSAGGDYGLDVYPGCKIIVTQKYA